MSHILRKPFRHTVNSIGNHAVKQMHTYQAQASVHRVCFLIINDQSFSGQTVHAMTKLNTCLQAHFSTESSHIYLIIIVIKSMRHLFYRYVLICIEVHINCIQLFQKKKKCHFQAFQFFSFFSVFFCCFFFLGFFFYLSCWFRT